MTRNDIQDSAGTEAFWRRGYHVFDDLANASQLAMLSRGMDVAETRGKLVDQTYSIASDAVGAYSPVPGEIMLRHCRSRIGAVMGRDLIENYAYWRRYHRGSVLRSHKDRAGCEITVTMTIDAPPEGPTWPIMLTDFEGNTIAVELPPGAGVMFLGSQLEHWREPLEAEWQKQLFLHYVVKDGEFADYAFDRRGADPLVQTAV
jgi:hypothetical protein